MELSWGHFLGSGGVGGFLKPISPTDVATGERATGERAYGEVAFGAPRAAENREGVGCFEVPS